MNRCIRKSAGNACRQSMYLSRRYARLGRQMKQITESGLFIGSAEMWYLKCEGEYWDTLSREWLERAHTLGRKRALYLVGRGGFSNMDFTALLLSL